MESDDPVTMSVITLGTIAAGTAVSTMGAIRQGQVGGQTAMMNAQLRARELVSQAQMAENQALQMDRDAELSLQSAASEREYTAFEVGRQRTQGEAFQAQQRADIAGSGLEMTGSPLLVMAETARQLEMDRATMTHAGEVRAREFEEEARMAKYGGELSRHQATQLRKGIPLTMDIGRYQARASRQAGQLGAVQSIISGGSRGLGAYYGAHG